MKVLWFTNNLVNLQKGTYHGGWMQSLERELEKCDDIELFVATRCKGKSLIKTIIGKTTYYQIPDKRNLLRKRIDLLFRKEPTWTMVGEYLKLVEAIQPDIIHVFGTELEYGLISMKTTIPVVVHIQGILNPYNYHIDRVSLPTYKLLASQSLTDYITGQTIGNARRIFNLRKENELKIFRTCRYFMGRTDWDRSITRLFSPLAHYFHCDELLRDPFYEKSWKLQKGNRIEIISVISNPLYKGHETIVASAKILKLAGIDFTWNIVGISKRDISYKLFYRDAVEKRGYIKIHGLLRPEEIVSLCCQSDIYVHPSHIENSSNSVCEAMALGMPIVSIYTGGNPTIITNGESGVLVPDNDPYFLSATIISLITDDERRLRIANYARKIALERHDRNRVIKELISIYDSVQKLHLK